MSYKISTFLSAVITLLVCACAHAEKSFKPTDDAHPEQEAEEAFHHGDDAEHGRYAYAFSCEKASSTQKAEVNKGNAKKDKFLHDCGHATNNSRWCEQLTRPNPENTDIFACTYGANQPFQLIHPTESTWKHAYEAVEIVEELIAKGIEVCLIYNWWRPEPYNANVGGAPGRHPYGTSVDVRFCSLADKEKAFGELCKMRRAGRINAVGYYYTTALHIGVGDRRENTWGKPCP